MKDFWAFAETVNRGEISIDDVEKSKDDVWKRLKILQAIRDFASNDLSTRDKILSIGIAIGYCDYLLIDNPDDSKASEYRRLLNDTMLNIPLERILTADDVAKSIGQSKKNVHLVSRTHDLVNKGFAMKLGNKLVFFESVISYFKGIKKKKRGPKPQE